MRLFVLLYGIISYLVFFGVFSYFILFVGDILAPKTVSSGVTENQVYSMVINILLLIAWGIQHSVMARNWFKQAIRNIVPSHTERSTYVLISSIVLAFLMLAWQPMHGVIWDVDNEMGVTALWVTFGLGWVTIFAATFLTNHFDLFGLRQTWLHFVKKSYTSLHFTERLIYQWIRHPMMLGILIAIWSTGTMTMSHFVFSVGMSVYVLIGIHFEEKSLVKDLGINYEEYQLRTAKLLPKVY